MTSIHNVRKRYRAFVELGVEEESLSFYRNGKALEMFQRDECVNSLANSVKEDPETPSAKSLRRVVEMDIVLKKFDV